MQSARTCAIIAAIALGGAAVSIYGFAPGLMTSDEVDILESGRSLNFHDWHSPIMQAIWGGLDRIVPGPLGMLLLVQVGYWTGFALIGMGLARRGWPVLGLVISLIGFFPTTLHFSAILFKDTVMAVFFLVALGLMVISETVKWRAGALAGAAMCIVLGVAIRRNAFAAAFPLIVLWIACLWPRERLHWWTWGIAGIAAVVLAFVVTQSARLILKPRETHVERSLMIFDLAGITYYSGHDQFDGALGPDFVKRNAIQCYDGRGWDVYAWGICKDLRDAAWSNPKLLQRWSTAIAEEPIAYIRHRSISFATLLAVNASWRADILVGGDGVGRIYKVVESAAWPLYAITPLISCMVLVMSLVFAHFLDDRFLATVLACVAASGLSYIGLYFLVSVSVDWRYGYWTHQMALISSPMGAVGLFSVARALFDRQHARLGPTP
jgi:hypothetical protein